MVKPPSEVNVLKKVRLVLIAVAAVSLAGLTVFAQPAPDASQNPAQERQARRGRMASRLNLTDAQREEIRKLRDEHRAATREQAQRLRDANRQLRDELFADNPDQNKIATLKSEIAQLSEQVRARRLEQQERYARILTPDQRKLMREHRQLRRERLRDWRQHRGFHRFRNWRW